MVLEINAALEAVPDYQRFLTVDEMFSRARQVAEAHPDIASYSEVGKSTDGEPIPMVRIGNGSLPIVLFACPHPNEPIGAMLIQFLLDELVNNEELRHGRSWYLLPCVDPDGTRLNEGWFAGPYTVRNYARNFYRPRSEEQVEWTFPINYKGFSWQTPMPETQALIKVFEEVRPVFVYSLHNAGFGGVYYYLSKDMPGAYEVFHRIPTEKGLFMSLGEPEMPYAVEFGPAVYKMPSVKDAYDYHEKYGSRPPQELIPGGASSLDYLETLDSPLLLVTELPYFQAEQISDTSPIDTARRDIILQGITQTREMFETVKEVLSEVSEHMTLDTRFYRAVTSFTRFILDSLESKERWAKTADGMDQPATIAQQADELYVGTFYRLLVASMLSRAIDAQLQVTPLEELSKARSRLERHLDSWAERIETNLDYSAIPIRKLVQVQYAALLALLPEIAATSETRA